MFVFAFFFAAVRSSPHGLLAQFGPPADSSRTRRAVGSPSDRSLVSNSRFGPNGGPNDRPRASRLEGGDRERQAISGEALCRTRTGDPFLTMEVLYQLS